MSAGGTTEPSRTSRRRRTTGAEDRTGSTTEPPRRRRRGRWAGRSPRPVPVPTALVPWIVASGLLVALLAIGIVQIVSHRGGFDAAYFAQASWLITHGHQPFVTIRGLNLLGDHFSPIMFLVALPTRFVPAGVWLMIVQAVALASAVLPLAAICRRHAHLGPGATTGVLLGYALFPALHNINASSFHPEALAVPALLGAILAALDRRWISYGVLLLVVLACREDIAITVAGFGVLVALTLSRRAGVLTAVGAVVVLALDVAVFMPHFSGGEFVQSGQLSRYGGSLGTQLSFMAGHPQRVLGDLVTTTNLTFVLQFLGPLLFLPLAAGRWLLPAVPLQLLYLLSDRNTAHTILSQYTAHAVPFAATAAAFGLAAVTGTDTGARLARLLVPVGLVALLATAKDSPLYALHPWALPDATDRAREQAAALVPDGAAVSASERMLPLLAERQGLYTFPGLLRPELPAWPGDAVGPARRAQTIGWIVVDTADDTQWSSGQTRLLETTGQQYGFRRVFEREGIVVLQRQPTG